ncbi:MAG: hypothetical protein RSN88_11675 [Gordonibacter sp.]|uniref:hypothetical protein n=1 Tax=Gordonibacter sp. TaxID=1968902 RepID=UPI002FCA0FEF
MKTETKFIAVLDRMTYIPVICQRFSEPSEREARMFSRAGFGGNPGSRYTFFYIPSSGVASYDPYKLGSGPTIPIACDHIRKHWGEIESGTAVDAEYLRGETDVPKTWEAEFNYDSLGVL